MLTFPAIYCYIYTLTHTSPFRLCRSCLRRFGSLKKNTPWSFGVCILWILQCVNDFRAPPKPFVAVSQLLAALRLPQTKTRPWIFGACILRNWGNWSPRGWGKRPAGYGGTARPHDAKAFLYTVSKNPFRQAWLGKKALRGSIQAVIGSGGLGRRHGWVKILKICPLNLGPSHP